MTNEDSPRGKLLLMIVNPEAKTSGKAAPNYHRS